MPQSQHLEQLHIVLVGSGDITMAAYKTFFANWRRAIKKNEVKISIVSCDDNYLCNDLLGEVITGRLEPQTASIKLAELAPHAAILRGCVTEVNRKSKELGIQLQNGTNLTLAYDHLVLESLMPQQTRSVALPDSVFGFKNIKEARLACREIDVLVKQAANARNPLLAKNLLRFVILVKTPNDRRLAAFVQEYIAIICSRFQILSTIKPECTIVDEGESADQTLIIQRITPEAVILENGSFLAASMIINCNSQSRHIPSTLFAKNTAEEIETDAYLRLKNESFIWSGTAGFGTSNQGKHIARNIILATKCCFLKPYQGNFINVDNMLFPNKHKNIAFGQGLKTRFLRTAYLIYLLFQLPSGKMRSSGILNLMSHFIWRKVKNETGLVHFGIAPANSIRTAS